MTPTSACGSTTCSKRPHADGQLRGRLERDGRHRAAVRRAARGRPLLSRCRCPGPVLPARGIRPPEHPDRDLEGDPMDSRGRQPARLLARASGDPAAARRLGRRPRSSSARVIGGDAHLAGCLAARLRRRATSRLVRNTPLTLVLSLLRVRAARSSGCPSSPTSSLAIIGLSVYTVAVRRRGAALGHQRRCRSGRPRPPAASGSASGRP